MHASALLSPKDARRIALRQGLLFGTFAGCIAFLSVACRSFVPIPSLNFLYLLALISFFFAGWRSTKKTSRIDIGALAGFWAGVAVGIAGLVIIFFTFFESYSIRLLGLSSLVNYGYECVITMVLALLVGPIVGALGGFLGNIYADSSVAPSGALPPASPVSQTPPSVPSQAPEPPSNQP